MVLKELIIGEVRVVLTDAECLRGNVRKNLCGIRGGAVIWTADLPGSPDYYADAWQEDGFIKAYVYSGHIVTIDAKDGRIISVQFTK